MAEAIAVEIATEVANAIIKKFGSAIYKKFLFVKDQHSYVERLREIKSCIEDAFRKEDVDPFETSRTDILRLRRLHDDLVNFFDELATIARQKEVMGNSKIATKVRLVSSTTKTFEKVMKDLKKFAGDYAATKGIITSSSGNQNRRASPVEETGPFPDTDVLIGRDTDKENIINILCNSSNDQMSPSVVAIVGVGGQGKTTLAQFVCNDERVKVSFGKPLWVSAAPDSSVREILEKIIASATNKPRPCNYEKEQLQYQLLDVIRGKKCLVVLDNVWYRDNLSSDWLELKTLLSQGDFDANGSKILITTRNQGAAKIMGIPKPCVLHDLAENDSWILLRHRARVQEKQPGVEEIGKEIAKMCPKLPLVIKVVGLHLAEMDTINQWKKFRDKFTSTSAWYMQHNDIMPTLKLCYDQLRDEHLKRCVVYCLLFPKGHIYSTYEMIRLWMALEFLEPSDGVSLEDVGERYVLKLAQLGFFERHVNDFGNSFEMHDVMHDLMFFIGKPEHQLINSETKDIGNAVHHVSLNTTDLNWRVLLEFNGMQNLQSIILVPGHRNLGSIQVPLGSGIDKLISTCKRLRVLVVYGQGIDKVPSSIGQMLHLRYLNLSGNPLKKLPSSITQLVNLLSLDVSYCLNLQELPVDIHKLEKLQELKIKGDILSNLRERGTLSHMPKGIGKLSNLEELDCFVVVGEDKRISGHNSKASGAANLEELGGLNNLQGDLWITVDGESKHLVSEAMTTRPLENKTEVNYLVVEFKNSTEEDEMFLEGLRPNGKKLRYMNIINYGGKRLPSWMRDEQFHVNFPKVTRIEFVYDDKYQYWYRVMSRAVLKLNPLHPKELQVGIRMRNVVEGDGMLEWVPGHSRLKEQSRWGPIDIKLTSVEGYGLKDLTLYSLEIEKHIAQSLLVGLNLERRSFLNIQKLQLWEISELEVIPNQIRHLSSLRSLRIIQCTNLNAIPDWIDSLTSLRELRIAYCPKLESLPHQIGSLAESCGLFIYDCSQVLVDKCRKPTGEYWPLIQHLCYIHIELYKGVLVVEGNYGTWFDKFRNTDRILLRQHRSNSATPTPITSNGSPSHSNTTSVKPYLFFSLAAAAVMMLILAYVVGLSLV